MFEFFISPAYAQSAGGAAGFDFMGLLPLVVIFVAFYFFLIRPQQKKAEEQKAMIDALKKGDKVVAAGGIIGTIEKLEGENEVVLKMEDGHLIRVMRASIGDKIEKNPSNVRSMNRKDSKTKPARKKK